MPKLTKAIVDRAEVPPKSQAFVWCSEDRGFGVRINASGSRTFIAQGRINGKERRVSIGRPGVSSVTVYTRPSLKYIRPISSRLNGRAPLRPKTEI